MDLVRSNQMILLRRSDLGSFVKFKIIALGIHLFLSAATHAHGIPNVGDHPVDWHTDQILRTMTFSGDREVGRVVTLDGKKCLEGRTFSFDVDDQYAFDIDE